jgi:cytoskeletal protein RodZ
MQHRVKIISPAKAERLRRQDEKKRREKRNSLRLLVGIVLLMVLAVGADYLWIKAMARQRREQHQRLHHHQPAQTNSPGTRVPTTGERTNTAKP